MAILQLTDVQRQANIVNDIHNVYHFETDGDPNSNDDIEEFINVWIEDIQGAITLIQSDQIVHLEVRAIELDGVFFATVPQGTVDGQVTGTAVAPYITYEFIYNRGSRLTRNGFKRFSGPVEEDIDQGGNVGAGVLANLNALALLLDDPITVSWAICTPIILGLATPPPPDGSGLPQRVGPIQSVAFHRVSTQNSRKAWR